MTRPDRPPTDHSTDHSTDPWIPPPTRREALRLGGALALAGPAAARAQQAPAPLGDGQPFEAARVVDLARALAKRPYAAPQLELPDALAKLSYEGYVAIQARPDALVWGGEGRGFVLEPLHRGFVFTAPVELHVVEDGIVRRLRYDRERYRFGAGATPPEAGHDLAFSGFRLYANFPPGASSGDAPPGSPPPGGAPPGADSAPREFAIAQGGTFLRVVAAGQSFGTTARALMLKPGEARGEEFPAFRAFWIERPAAGPAIPGARELVAHALVDSESATAAFRFAMRPGETSLVEVKATLFARAELAHVGLGGATAAYLFGTNDRARFDDARAAVHAAGGLRILNGGGEALWRPLHNPETLQISAFLDRDPRGFGLTQRARGYAAFQDDVARWERRPSLWIEPRGAWGEGAVQLIEIPSSSEVNENVMAYWRPRAAVPAGGELALAYRQHWCWAPPGAGAEALAETTATRVGRAAAPNAGTKRRRVLVDFTGDALAAPVPGLKPAASASPGTVRVMGVFPYPERRTLRVDLELDPGGETACEMRLVLEAGGRTLSETWLYRWTP